MKDPNRKKLWGVVRASSKRSCHITSLIGTFVGMGSILFYTRKAATNYLAALTGEGGEGWNYEVKKFNKRKDGVGT